MINRIKSTRDKKFFPWMMLFVSALLYTFGIQAFLQTAHCFSAGFGAIAALPTYIWPEELGKYFSIFYFIFNFPLIVFFWKKVKKTFIYRSLFFLVVQTALGSLFLINDIHDFFADEIIIKHEAVLQEGWPIYILSSLAGMFVGISVGIAYKYGGSSGGTDIITYYYSTKKKKNIGTVALIVSMIFVVIAMIITLINVNLNKNDYNDNINDHFVAIAIGTLTYIIIQYFLLNFIYPRYSKVRVEIHSDKIDEIIEHLGDINKYLHSFQIHHVVSGYTKDKKTVIVTMMLLLELNKFLITMKEIDPEVWISATIAKKQTGNFNTSSVE